MHRRRAVRSLLVGSTLVGTPLVRFRLVGVEKMSVSFDLELGEAIRSSATTANQSVSAWLAEAARDRLRIEALGEAITGWEEQYGTLTEAEVSEAAGALDRGKKRRRGAA